MVLFKSLETPSACNPGFGIVQESRDNNSQIHEKLGLVLDVMIFRHVFSSVRKLHWCIGISVESPCQCQLSATAAEAGEVLNILQGLFVGLDCGSRILGIWSLLTENFSFLGVECEA